MLRSWVQVVATASIACSVLAAPAMSAAARVHILTGDLAGMQQKQSEAYLGIPYAAPPVGANRWRSPQSAHSWSGVRAADHFSDSCIQPLTPLPLGPYTHEYH